MATVRVLFFAKSKELSGVSATKIELEKSGFTGNDLLETIINKYPKFETFFS
jgi:hypothetical protein